MFRSFNEYQPLFLNVKCLAFAVLTIGSSRPIFLGSSNRNALDHVAKSQYICRWVNTTFITCGSFFVDTGWSLSPRLIVTSYHSTWAFVILVALDKVTKCKKNKKFLPFHFICSHCGLEYPTCDFKVLTFINRANKNVRIFY